jgi:tRNA dimethylallyltransferase
MTGTPDSAAAQVPASVPVVEPPDAVCLMGPTCTGKTALALALAERFPVEIVSVDSALVYRGMDIGTSKPSLAERARVPHHLIDLCDPSEPYSAGRFQRDALACIDAIRARGKVPLLVGGTMLYFRSLTHGLAPLPEADPYVRSSLDSLAQASGWPALHAELAKRDPVAASRIQPLDAQRIQRALEVLQLTGQRMSELQRLAEPPAIHLARFALLPVPRPRLYERINARFGQMLEAGLLDEVRHLRDRGDLDPDLPSVRAVGYRQLWQHLAGECTLDQAAEAARQATRNLAKRQLTWLRADPEVTWLSSLEERELAPISGALAAAAGKIAAKTLC